MTFPGGTHDCWIRYWLAAGGIDPDKDIETIVVPPPQMVANMKVGTMDCFCVGEPWNEQLKNQKIGYTAINTAEMWNKHPEKSFAMRAEWVDKHPNATKALLMAVLEAQMWCDEPANRVELATHRIGTPMVQLSGAGHPAATAGAFRLRHPRQGRGQQPAHHEVLEGQRLVSVSQPRAVVPRRGRALGQVQRLRGLEGARCEGQSRGLVARGRNGARSSGGANTASTSRGLETFFDGKVFDPENPEAYLASLAIKRSS